MKNWIEAARPRTLPLALSCIFMGTFLAGYQGVFDGRVFGLACLTTILLQILSNFANDYGDTQNGADSLDRVGPQRAVQSGEISPESMFKAIIIFGVLSLVSGILLLYFAFRQANLQAFWWFLGLGLLCILAAYTYTAGKKPYGYAGLGDISVLIFFGLVGVLGSNFLFTHRFEAVNILPALSCGFLATGVLNLNNIRDIESDTKAGKFTIPARLGKQKAIVYHWILLALAALSILAFALMRGDISWYFLIAFPLFLINAIKVKKLDNPDPLLKQLALSTLFFVILSGLSMLF
ncbi:1,4-dihydroxy-2-naphthoate polyprenyltransferase [Jiulongibacter sediminis]|uniref:1,4-dihydroxy-2-naphthoate octaprenyltransferase n=1 Tax=Jiulongibacter sediminis TaxID=1605367 RepID=A0A0P7C6T0_9BACT|nr:1,4-dihydroxy-2-naphthoate polyprenyltransferase [Jiulongibacter sediminis]KPM48065.1 1,4-dihydroxy-2-naphthoate prenyltransferase [Jiulongibacter sediminis]TBX24246.1 1,4-dihydroxy-2-naphthoate prenyltransferase [Jiulongibacter sediminis]